jgi:light-regulated signal transduction histidine kinase (bacteriophytochrome)
MGSLIDDLLNLSRIPRGTVVMVPIDLSALAREICSTMTTAWPDRVVDWTVAPGIWGAGEPKMMRIVMENLLDNAWKYTKRAARATVEVGTTVMDGTRVCFVRDNGAGFDMAYAGKLFGVFQRLHKEEDYEGTGVGLAIVKRIMQRHGGDVWAESRVNEGTTFYFTLPAEPVDPPEGVNSCCGVQE